MDSWAKGIAAVTLFVEDLAAAKQFYGEGGHIWEIAS